MMYLMILGPHRSPPTIPPHPPGLAAGFAAWIADDRPQALLGTPLPLTAIPFTVFSCPFTVCRGAQKFVPQTVNCKPLEACRERISTVYSCF